MTNEEAIKELQMSLDTLREYDIAHSSRLKQALEMAIRTLENHDIFMKRAYSQGKQDALLQEPCDDAISREAVLNTEYHVKIINDIEYVMLSEVQMKIRKIPPITQKSGKWIITHLSNMAYCSECDYLFKDVPAIIVEHFKHCPNCGAKMESEE